MAGALPLVGAALLFAACGGNGATTAPAATLTPTAPASSAAAGAGISATEVDFGIQLSASSAAAGPITFNIQNTGEQTHEFVVVKTDLAADKLPMDGDSPEVDEDASSLTAVDEVEDIAAGTSGKLDVTLQPGHYVVFCNVPGHYQLGMHTDFTVNP
jgi:uncharacterized cupredoxin-like copper-binding protein